MSRVSIEVRRVCEPGSAVGGIAREPDRGVVGRHSLVRTSEESQQVCAGGVERVIVGQSVGQSVDLSESDCRTVVFAERDGSVEPDDGGGFDLDQPVVQRHDL